MFSIWWLRIFETFQIEETLAIRAERVFFELKFF